MSPLLKSIAIPRRKVLGQLALGMLSWALIRRAAFADPAALAAELGKLFGTRPIAAGRIKLEAPAVADNGALVPVAFEIDSPMTEADHVRALHVFADGNPAPGVATYRFTPACGRARVSFRMRLARTQNIVCVAEMSDGSLFTATAEVRVTIGGCVV